jgi:hypothetical protein
MDIYIHLGIWFDIIPVVSVLLTLVIAGKLV